MSYAGIAQSVEHNLSKVGVMGSSPISRSRFGRIEPSGASIVASVQRALRSEDIKWIVDGSRGSAAGAEAVAWYWTAVAASSPSGRNDAEAVAGIGTSTDGRRPQWQIAASTC